MVTVPVVKVLPVADAALNTNVTHNLMDVCAHKAAEAVSVCVVQVKVLGAALHVNGSVAQN
jgi:hypothetical protein